MHTRYWLIGAAALTLVVGSPIAAQGLDRRVGDGPGFVVGDTIRVWMEPALGLRVIPFRVRVTPVRVAGAVLANWAPDSVNLRRTAPILYPWDSRHRTVFWGEVNHVDVANGRVGIARGAAAGLIPAAIWGLSYSLLYCVWGGNCGGAFLRGTAYAAIVTVPLGAVLGALTPKWKRVY